MFRAPDSTPPSTPDRSLHEPLSTTPAGPPPSSVFGSRHVPAVDAGDAMDEDVDDPFEADFLSRSTNLQNQSVSRAGNFDVHGLAKSLARPMSGLQESDDMILVTSKILDKTATALQVETPPRDDVLANGVQRLLRTWQELGSSRSQDASLGSDAPVGPGSKSSATAKANFLANLLLQLHHPPPKILGQKQLQSSRHGLHNKPIPEVLLDWLRAYHWPLYGEFEEVLHFRGSCAAHDRFWDIVFSTTVRGNIRGTIELLENADFRQAVTALEDGADRPGYFGKQLSNIDLVVGRCVEVLSACPALHETPNWDVRGPEWAIFRKLVNIAVSDLEAFSESVNANEENRPGNDLGSSAFGSTFRTSLGKSTRHAESKVPWAVYQNLTYLYGQLLGTRSEVVAASGDWVEATIATAIWWDGEDIDAEHESLAASRRSSRKVRRERLVDSQPVLAYSRRLAAALQELQSSPEAADDLELQVNPADPMSVALACVVSDDVDGAVSIMQAWSPVIASTVVEIADWGSWLGLARAPTSDILEGFNASDLMVLGYAPQETSEIKRDDILGRYADLLSERGILRDSKTGIRREAWHLAVEIIGRSRNQDEAARKIGQLLDRLELTDGAQVDATVTLCNRLGLHDHARRLSTRYADSLMESTHKYGEAIFNYVRAGQKQKIKDVLDLLCSLCLVQSMAYPPASELDASMLSIINTPAQTIVKLNRLDHGSAETLLAHLSGYATLRKFYELRDQEVLQLPKQDPSPLRPLARKREAATALVALIESASDCIHGGLYDGSVDSAMQVDGILVLLGEVLPFVNQPRQTLTAPQIAKIMKAIEEISTVSSTVFDQAAECLKSTLANAQGAEAPTPSTLLRKSTSGLSASTYSLIGSEMTASMSKASTEGSGVLVGKEVKRGWDWRRGLDKRTMGEDVLKMLRLELAKELSRAWLAEGK